MTPTKTIQIEDLALPIISDMVWETIGTSILGKLTCGQLSRPLYLAVNKGLTALGGKWNRKLGGHVFPTDPRPHLASLLDTGKIDVEKDGFFVTPHAIGRQMAEMAELYPGVAILEPSAGTGELAEAILSVAPTCNLSVAEKNEQRQQVLDAKNFYLLVRGPYDFLTYDVGKWTRIIQNPPFEDGQDILHIRRAYDCLSARGILVSVISEGTFFREYKRDVDFRQWLAGLQHRIVSLGDGAFKASGTMVKARLVKITK